MRSFIRLSETFPCRAYPRNDLKVSNKSMLAWQLSSGKFEFIATNAHIFLSGCFPVDSLFARSLPPSTFPIRHGSASSDRPTGGGGGAAAARISIGDGGMGMTGGWMAAAAGEICCLLTRTVAGPTAAIDGSGCARRGAGQTQNGDFPPSLLISQVG